MKNILHVIGTRPNLIKASVVSKDKNFNHYFVDTNQHYAPVMQEEIYKDLKVDTDNIFFLENKKYLSNNVTVICNLIKEYLHNFESDLLVVYGDTNTTVAGCLAAKSSSIKLAHVESGLRSWDNYQIEEANRIIVDNLSDYRFTPTKSSLDNLVKENLSDNSFFTGDLMFDLFLNANTNWPNDIDNNFRDKEFYVCSIHRYENINDRDNLQNILKSLSNLPLVIFTKHHSFDKSMVKFNISYDQFKNIKFIDPLRHSEILGLIKESNGVITDSGGLQKESYWLNKPTVILRKSTEWVELINSGNCVLINRYPSDIYEVIKKISLIKNDVGLEFGSGKALSNLINKFRKILDE